MALRTSSSSASGYAELLGAPPERPRRRSALAESPALAAATVAAVLGAIILGALTGFQPLYAAAILLGLGYVVLVLTDLAAAVALFTTLGFVESLGGGEGGTSFLKLAGVLLAAFWAFKVLRGRAHDHFMARHPVATYSLLLLVAWSGLTALWAYYPDTAVSTAIRLLQQVVLFFVVYTAIDSRRGVLLVVGGYLLGASISAGMALADPSAVMVDGDGLARASGGAGDPNVLAGLLVPGIILAGAVVAARGVPAWGKLLSLGAIAVCLPVFMLTLSRGGLIGLAVAFAAALVLAGRWRLHVALLGLAGAAAVVAFYLFFADPAAVQRALNPGGNGGSGRSDIWLMGTRMVADHPVGGVGIGNYKFVSNQYLVRPGLVERDDYILDDPKQAHNMYLDMLAETGAVGFALFVGIIAFAVWCTWQAARRFERVGDRGMELLARATLIGLVGLLVSDFFLSEQLSKQLWVLLALGPALLKLAQARSDVGPAAGRNLTVAGTK